MTLFIFDCSINNMKKIRALIVSFSLLCGLLGTTIPVSALYPCSFTYPGQDGNCEGCQDLIPSECHANCTPTTPYFYGYNCHDYIQKKRNGGVVFPPSPTPLPTILPACKPALDGEFYFAVAVDCTCPNGVVISSMGGFTSQCQWNTHPIYCAHGSSVYGCYTPTPQTKTCWDGTQIPVSHSCPTQTQTCWNGSIIPIYQACPVQQPTCSYYQYWNGYQCVSLYQPLPYWPQYPVYVPTPQPTRHCSDSAAWIYFYPECDFSNMWKDLECNFQYCYH